MEDTPKVFDDFKNRQKTYEVMFFDTQNYTYSENLFNILHIELQYKHIKSLFKVKQKLKEMYPFFLFFFPFFQLITVSILIHDF